MFLCSFATSSIIPILSIFFQCTDRVIPFGQIKKIKIKKIRFSHLAEGLLQNRNGYKRVSDGFRSSRMVKTYQSQVIPAAVQRSDHHLLINNPYWTKETKNSIKHPFHSTADCNMKKIMYFTVHLWSKLIVSPLQGMAYFLLFHNVNKIHLICNAILIIPCMDH